MSNRNPPQKNPIFGPNRLKLGIFGTNSKGSALTLAPEAYKPTWDAVMETSRLADAAGYEAIVAYARWKSYVENCSSHPNHVVLDPFVFAAGVAQATSYSAIFTTSHAPTMHPIVAAKQCATIDIISDGRLVLNVVAGWNKAELEMFGAPLKEHEERYEHLAEWFHVVEKLWQADDEFDHDGRFFKIVRGLSRPRPVQAPRPPIMNAAGSATGRRFACEHADVCFLLLDSGDQKGWASQIEIYKAFARSEFGREVQVWTYAPVVQRETMQEAQRYLHYYAIEHADNANVDGWIRGKGMHAKGASLQELGRLRTQFAAGGGDVQLVGTPDHIAGRLQELSDAGLDGILLTWVDFVDGMSRFNRDVMPLLEQRGLRQPFTAAANGARA